MQEKFSIVAIAAVITAVFASTLAMSLTVQPVLAGQQVCSPKSGACATDTSSQFATNAFTSKTQAGYLASGGGAAHTPNNLAAVGGTCPGTTVIHNGKTTCGG